MAHQHSDHHGHSHHHPVALTHINRAFIAGIVFNLLFVVIEVITGLYIHSLSLLSDAGHNLADVGSLALSLLAFRLVKVKANERYTYGYRKTSILTALFNSVLLLVSIGAIIYESVHRFMNPEPLPGKTIAIVAAIGILVNAGTAVLFLRHKEKDLNIKSAYLHLLSDAVVSAALVVGGIVISYTNWYWLDPALGILVGVVILYSTWGLLKDSLRLSMDGVPAGIDLNKISEEALKIKGVHAVHHIHVWAMSTTENAMTVHMVIADSCTAAEEQALKHSFRHAMEHLDIQHVTIETERESATVANTVCGIEK
jgi:cobalt-zinc-cadmium efflux system protein